MEERFDKDNTSSAQGEGNPDVHERAWAQVVPMVHWALNAAYRECIPPTWIQVLMGRAPPTALSALAPAGQGGWDVDSPDVRRMREMMMELAKRREVPHRDILRGNFVGRWRYREAPSILVFFPCMVSATTF